MSYISPGEFVKTMVDAGESKLFMATRDVLIRSFMAGAILAIAVALAVTAAVQTGIPIVGALIFPVGFCILNLLGFDLLTGVFALVPLALFAAGWFTVFVKGILCNWMVSVGVVGAMLSKDVIGKVIAMWMPILIFFGLVFEHAFVNMYLFPLGMMMGAPITIADW